MSAKILARSLLVSLSALCAFAGCFVFPGTEGKRCNRLGQCVPGLACDPRSFVCEEAESVRLRYCEGKQCGIAVGFDCGGCPGRTEVCQANACVNVCAGLGCGMVGGVSCGDCAGATEICDSNQCRDACAGKQCGTASGKDCGTCEGATEVCLSNQCQDACRGKQCGMALGKDCGVCAGASEVCESNQCRDACAGKQCGMSMGKECGTCSGPTELCQANQCRDACAGKQCGMSDGKECGTCAGPTELCQGNQCVDVCAGLSCGEVSGRNCGMCTGTTEVCRSNRCVDVCAGLSCGEVFGFVCGSCTGATELCQVNQCVNVCAGLSCGDVSGLNCGTCTGATELCQSNRCIDVCAGLSCGEVSGLNCGTCTGATELCQSNRCVDVCTSLSCGEVSGVSCGTCPATSTCRQNQCESHILVLAGTFTMGSPPNEPDRLVDEVQHPVTLTYDFWLKASEVTQGEWQALMGNTPWSFVGCGPTCPVEGVSWFEAVEYVNALSRSEGLPECYVGPSRTFVGLSCRGYRLPTEAEWEYAARAGTLTSSYNGDVTAGYLCDPDPALSPIAWFCANAAGAVRPVRGNLANPWGFSEMLGNVWEWTNDFYGAYGSGPATDPLGPSTGSGRVIRGGGWSSGAAACRAAIRFSFDPSSRADYVGFRTARSAGP
jgi:formylglycine-generating enzyme required for sulfatase activity